MHYYLLINSVLLHIIEMSDFISRLVYRERSLHTSVSAGATVGGGWLGGGVINNRGSVS